MWVKVPGPLLQLNLILLEFTVGVTHLKTRAEMPLQGTGVYMGRSTNSELVLRKLFERMARKHPGTLCMKTAVPLRNLLMLEGTDRVSVWFTAVRLITTRKEDDGNYQLKYDHDGF